MGSFLYGPARLTDTKTYERVAHAPLWSFDFVAGERAFTVPLFYKLLSDDHARITGQLVVSIVCWLTLAAVAAFVIQHRILRPVAFVLVLLFSATTEIILWDPLLLSESVSVSLTALLFASWLWLARRPTTWNVAAVLTVSFFWAYTRDTNAYVVLFTGVLALVSLTHSSHRPLKAVLVLGTVAIFVAAAISANDGRRWSQPLRDVLLNRVDADPTMHGYFERELGPRWREADARSTYARYLISHPSFALVEPFVRSRQAPASTALGAEALLDPNLRIYNDNARDRAFVLPRPIREALWIGALWWILAVTADIVALAVVVALSSGVSTTALVPLGALLSTYPHGLLVWHLSGLEIDRHALGVAVVLRIALLLLLLLSLDAALQRRRGSRDASATAMLTRLRTAAG